jgi:putative oxidoreductase
MSVEPSIMRKTGMFFIRMLLGLIFFFQGYGKIFSMGVSQVYDRFFKDFENTKLPKWLIVSTAYYTSWVELIGGFLLIIGLFRKQALYLLALDLLVVSFGHGFMEPIWDLSHVIPRAVLVSALFLLPPEWDMWNADTLQKKTVK